MAVVYIFDFEVYDSVAKILLKFVIYLNFTIITCSKSISSNTNATEFPPYNDIDFNKCLLLAIDIS